MGKTGNFGVLNNPYPALVTPVVPFLTPRFLSDLGDKKLGFLDVGVAQAFRLMHPRRKKYHYFQTLPQLLRMRHYVQQVMPFLLRLKSCKHQIA